MPLTISIVINDDNSSVRSIEGPANNINRSIAISEMETIKNIFLKDNSKNSVEVNLS